MSHEWASGQSQSSTQMISQSACGATPGIFWQVYSAGQLRGLLRQLSPIAEVSSVMGKHTDVVPAVPVPELESELEPLSEPESDPVVPTLVVPDPPSVPGAVVSSLSAVVPVGGVFVELPTVPAVPPV